MLSWMLIDMNSYFASCEQQDDPRLRNRPIAVVPMLNVATSTILAASYEAKKFGIKTGTLAGDAKKMCPAVQFVELHHDRYVHYHDRIAEVIESVLPIEQVLSIDEFGCRLTGSQRSKDQAVKIAHEIKKRIEGQVGQCLTTSIGIAQNLILSKVASDLEKPNGLVIIDEENREALLGPLSVRVLPGVGAQMEKRLNFNRYYKMSDLFQASESELRRVWGGIIGDRFYGWIRGQDIKQPYTVNRSLGHQHVLSPDLRTADASVQVLKKLLVRAAARLRKQKFYAKRMNVSVKYMRSHFNADDDASWETSLSFDETHDPIVLIEILRRALTNMPTDKKPIRVGVSFHQLVPADQHQLSLFDDPQREVLLNSIDAVNKKFGKDALTIASIHDLQAAGQAKIAFQHIPDEEDL
jgi:DNA polymerase-4